MVSRFYSDQHLDLLAREFNDRGFLKIENALSSDQVIRFNAAVERHRDAHPQRWVELSDSFREGTNVLPDTGDFDEAIENPKTLAILRAIIGEDITFEEFAIMLRDSTSNLGGWRSTRSRSWSTSATLLRMTIVLRSCRRHTTGWSIRIRSTWRPMAVSMCWGRLEPQ